MIPVKNPNHTGIIVRFWETAHLPLPYANVLP